MKLLDFDTPPKFFEYNGQIVEDMGGYFLTPDGHKLPIVKVWEEGAPIGDEKPNQTQELPIDTTQTT